MHIIGIDGSLRNFGFAVFEYDTKLSAIDSLVTIKLSQTTSSKDKKLKKSSDDLIRFGQHYAEMCDLIKKYDIKTAIVEVPHGAKDARAAFAFGGVTAILSTLPKLGLDLIQVTPKEVKEGSVGYSYADKEDIIAWAYKMYPDAEWQKSKRKNAMAIIDSAGLYLKNENEHMADAIAIVYAGKDQIK